MYSLSGKIWKLKNSSPDGTLLERVLKYRNIGDIESPLSALHDPFLMKDMERVVKRVMKAVQTGERIMIYGDYDVDGVTSSALLYSYLSSVGAKVSVRLPNRFTDGYGLNSNFVGECKKLNIGLVITVDCGVSDIVEIRLANSYGIDVIITDHHAVPDDIPEAFAILNPKQHDCGYPEKDLAGVGVAFKLMQALDVKMKTGKIFDYLDLVALATTADCMPITGENRIFVKQGLKKLSENPHPSLDELLKEVKADRNRLSPYTFGFQIGPPLNAAGRLDSALDAFYLLTGKREYASKLVSMNIERQGLMKHGVQEAEEMVGSVDGKKILIVKNKNWGIGIIGLIGSKLTEKFHRPSIILTERQGEFIGSARSISGYGIIDALTRHKELFTHFGGHAQAAGFSLLPEKYEEFLDVMMRDADENIRESDLVPTLYIDTEIQPNEISFESVDALSRLEPFGLGNTTPLFLVSGVSARSGKSVGGGGEHASFLVDLGNQRVRAIAFGFGKHIDLLNSDKKFDLAVQMEADEWQGNKRLQLVVRDIGTGNMER